MRPQQSFNHAATPSLGAPPQSRDPITGIDDIIGMPVTDRSGVTGVFEKSEHPVEGDALDYSPNSPFQYPALSGRKGICLDRAEEGPASAGPKAVSGIFVGLLPRLDVLLVRTTAGSGGLIVI